MSRITLKGITWDHSRGYDPLIAASEVYLEQFDMEVTWQKRSLKNFGDQSITDLAQQFDLLINDHPHSGVAAETGCVVPLDKHLDDDQLAQLEKESAGPSFSSYRYQGHQWALPIDAAMQSAVYRQDLMIGPVPSNWEEVFQLAEQLKKEGKHVGMALCPTDALCSFLSLTAQSGSPIKEGNEQLIKEEAGIRVLTLMEKMRDHFHPESLNWNPIQLYDHMAENDDIVYAPLTFNYTNYSRKGFRKHLLTFINAPGIISVLGGAGIAVSSNCKHIQEAVDYAYWICSSDIQKSIYTEQQGQPGNVTAWEDSTSNALTNHFFTNTRQTLDKAYVRPRYAGWPVFQEYLGEVVWDYLKNGRDPVVTLDVLQRAFENSK